MSRIEFNSDRHVTIWRYKISEIKDIKAACTWLIKVMHESMFAWEYLSLRDLMNRSDEGNSSMQIIEEIKVNELYDNVKKTSSDLISLTGVYKEEIIVVAVDLRTKNISITLKNKNKNLISEIENQLHLVE